MAEVSLQDQIWIWGGVLLGLWVFLAGCVLGLCLRVRKIAKVSAPRMHKDAPNIPMNGRKNMIREDSVFNFGSPSIIPGEELAKRGYSSQAPPSEPEYGQSTDFTFFTSDLPSQPHSQGGWAPPAQDPPARPKNALANGDNFYKERRRNESPENPNFIY